MSNKIAYENHPVSRERKAELIAAGYKIIDARFAPQDQQKDEAPKKRAAPKKRENFEDEI